MFVLAQHPFFQAYAQADLFGKLIFILLFFLSIITWVLIVQKFRFYLAFKRASRRFKEEFLAHDRDPLNCPESERESHFTAIYQRFQDKSKVILRKNQEMQDQSKPVSLSSDDINWIAAHVETSILEEKKKLDRFLFLLPTTVRLAPFLGLLGTVWGILLTLGDLQGKNFNMNNEMVMGGLSMALGTTVLGLLVAIPAIIAQTYFRNEVQTMESEMEEFSTDLLSSVELRFRES